MVALTVFLALHQGPAARAVIACGERMLRHYALFFIPAGVGVMTQFGAVALGIPLARNLGAIRRDALPVVVAVLAGALVAAVTAPLLLHLMGGTPALALSVAPKAVTTPIAMGIAARIGGVPTLAAIFAILGGVVTAVLAKPVLGLLRIEDHRSFGLAAGVAGSGIAAAEAVARHEQAGAYAALAVGLNAIVSALIVPGLAALGWL